MKFYLFGTMRTCFLMQLVLLTVFFVSVSVVRANIVTFQFEGELTTVTTPLEGEFSVGDSFVGTYTFESNTPVDPGADPDIYSFYYLDAVLDISLNIGTFTASASSGKISYDFEDDSGFFVYSNQVVASSLDNFVPYGMGVGWGFSNFGIPQGFFADQRFSDRLLNGPLIYPGFDPDLPPIEFASEIPFYDANGNLVYDPYSGFVGNLDQPLFDRNGSRIRNGWFSFSFLGDGDQRPFIFGILNSVTVVRNIPSLLVPDNKWIQIGLNTAPPTGSTVADIIGDDISALYGSEWVVYSYQTSTNSYKQLSLTDTMLPGIGYWFIQATGNPVTIDMPTASTGVNVTGHPACPSISEGCFEIPLQTSNSIDTQWQMIGYPFRDNRNIDKIRVVTRDIGSDCFIGCTLKEASEKGLVSESMYHFDETSYQQLTTEGSEPFEPWDGAWIAILPAASGQYPKLLIPATN